MRIRFLKSWGCYSAGDVATLDVGTARRLISEGIAYEDGSFEGDFETH